MWMPEGKEKEWEESNVWRNVYSFLEVIKDTGSQIQEAQEARQTNQKKKKKNPSLDT